MASHITPREFHELNGIEDWRVLLVYGACAYFRTTSFASGVALVEAIGRLASDADHYPDVDLRQQGVSVRLATFYWGGLSNLDVTMARQISAAARELDAVADPTAIQQINIAVDALVGTSAAPFWRALLGYEASGPEDLNLTDPVGRGPAFWFLEMDKPRPQRNRIHIDICVPHDQAEARMAAALDAGGRLLTDQYAPAWWVLADSEGNEACLVSWTGRD